MKKIIFFTLIILVSVSIIGCSDDFSGNWKYDTSKLEKDMLQMEVREVWGDPSSTYSHSDGSVTWTYTNSSTKGYESYDLYFDSYGLLEDWSSYRSEN